MNANDLHSNIKTIKVVQSLEKASDEFVILQLSPDFGISLVQQKSVAKIEFRQNPTVREKLLRT